MITEVRRRVEGEEFDYQTLVALLKDYRHPRDKITAMLRRGELIRVKKGIYVFGKNYARRPYSREILANMIYGPSCVSLEYALHYHGLIPERSEAVTSVTTGRSRRFQTPVGLFTYRQIPVRAFPASIERVEIQAGSAGFLIASAEKALADKLQADRGTGVRTLDALRSYLFDSLRIDPGSFAGLNSELITLLAKRYRSRKLRLVCQLLVTEFKETGQHE